MSWLTRQPEAAFCLRKPAILQALSRASLSATCEIPAMTPARGALVFTLEHERAMPSGRA